jgi:hypothetical protein
MQERYRDIRDLISTPPIWFDEIGVPRYAAFEPRFASNGAAQEVALLRIRCQACRTQFFAAVSSGRHPSLREAAARGFIEYGDPPERCCEQGRTMSTETMDVVEFWDRGPKWRRDTALEWQVMPDSYR